MPLPTLTAAEAVEAYVQDRLARGEIGANTARQLQWRLGAVAEVVGADQPITALDKRAVAAYQRRIGERSPASRRAFLSTLRVFVAWLVDEGHLDVDPTARMSRVREPRRIPRALNAEEVARLLAACTHPRERFAVRIMLALGLRRVELARLELGDIDRDRRLVWVRGKADHERMLPLVAAAEEALVEYLAWRGSEPGPLMTALTSSGGCTGEELDPAHVGLVVNRVFARAGLKRRAYDGISGHALRHTAASDVLDQCGNVRTVQAMLGHASLQTTQMYLRRASLDQLRTAMAGRNYGAGAGR